MAQVTGRKVATTPIVPTPSGGNVINSWNTSDNKETNAPSMKIVKDDLDAINDNLAQTPITVGGITMDTIDEKLNFLCNGGGGNKLMTFANVNAVLVVSLSQDDVMPKFEINAAIPPGATDTRQATYIYTVSTPQSGNWCTVDVYAKNSGKYAIKGFSTLEDTVVTVSANEKITRFANTSGHNMPALISNNTQIATIQYLGDN